MSFHRCNWKHSRVNPTCLSWFHSLVWPQLCQILKTKQYLTPHWYALLNREGPGVLYQLWYVWLQACMITDNFSYPQIQLVFLTQTYWSYLCDFSALDFGSLTVTQLAGRKLACFLTSAFELPLHFVVLRVCPRSMIFIKVIGVVH